MCKCRNRGVIADACEGIMSDGEYVCLSEASESQWARREELTQEREEFGDGTAYNLAVHRKWCNEENYGICHWGSFADNYKISQIRFDVFHGRSAIVKVVLKHIRNRFEGIPDNVTKFAGFLRKLPSWDGYVIDPWVANHNNSRIKGRHTKDIIHNIPQCITV